MLTFTEKGHKYTSIPGAKKINWISATKIISMYHEHFPTIQASESCSKSEKSKYYGNTPEQIREIWRKENERSTREGSLYHDNEEQKILSKDFMFRNGKKLKVFKPNVVDGVKYAPSQILSDGVYPEHFVYNEEYGVCGQSDLIICQDYKIHELDYKGLCLETEIPTNKGFKKMREVNINDVIYDGNGNETKIKHISNIHYNKSYRITFDNNTSIICDYEHRWVISDRKGTNNWVDIEMETEEMYSKFKSKKTLRIKCSKIKGEKKHLTIDPYILGCWLGDGNNQTGVITSMNNKVWDYISSKGFEMSKDISGGGSGKAEMRTVYGLRKLLKELDLIYNKHIPEEYMLSSFDQRLLLLRGLMDADGHFHEKRKRCVMNTTSINQAEFLSSLCSSLGLKTTIIPYTAKINSKKYQAYAVNFRCNEFSPFLLRNENYLDICGDPTVKSRYLFVKKIEEIPIVPTKCIAVESDEKTYLATRNYIKTHNTNKKLVFEELDWKTGLPKKMLGCLSHLNDCNFNHYQIQLSIYMYIMLLHNPDMKRGKMAIKKVAFKKIAENEYGYPIHEYDANGIPKLDEKLTKNIPTIYLEDEVKEIFRDLKLSRF